MGINVHHIGADGIGDQAGDVGAGSRRGGAVVGHARGAAGVGRRGRVHWQTITL